MAGDARGRVYRPQGWLSPVLLVGGRMEAVWRHERRAGGVAITLEPLPGARPDARVRAAAEAEAARLAPALGGGEVTLSRA